MRISNRSLGVYVPGLREFVPASWTIPENPFLGPGMAGLREFVPAKFTLPPQPAGIGMFVPAKFTLPPQPAGVGDFVGTAEMYPIPQNSVTAAAAANPNMASWETMGMSGLGCGGGCGCGGKCGGGMGQLSTDFGNTVSNLSSGNFTGAWSSFMSFLEDPLIGTVPVWMIGGGALLAYALFFSGGEHSRYSRGRKASAAARRAYA
jgi:hypothetical protein